MLGKLRKLDSVKRKGSGLDACSTLAPAGVELLGLAASVESMLADHPGGPHAFGSDRTQELVDVMVRGKGSGVLDALADGPKTADEIVSRVQDR
jgi:hypothetical protein